MINENIQNIQNSSSQNTQNIKSKTNSEEKIKIENAIDLYKLPISTLKNAKIFNFSGKLYDKIYKEALEMEKVIISKKPPLEKKILNNNENQTYDRQQFNKPTYNTQIYNTQFNTPQNYGNMNYTNLNQSRIKINKIKFEMKYQTQMGQEVGVIGSLDELGKWNQNKVLRLNWQNGNVWNKEISYVNGSDFEFKFIFINNGRVVKWEDGNNRPFNFRNVCSNLEKKNIKNGVINIWNLNNQNLEFDTRNYTLKVTCEWNKK